MNRNNLLLVKFAGGLGNQLFQYAMGIYLSKIMDIEVHYFNECNNISKHNKIEKIIESIPYASKEEEKQVRYYFHNHKYYRLVRKILGIFSFLRKDVIVENGSQYHSHINEEVKVFDGYWQSYQYIASIDDIIRTQVNLDAYETPFANDILADSHAVFVHIRRGDYLDKKNEQIFESCTIDYFIKAMSILVEHIPESKFYIISNDTTWVTEHFRNTTYKCIFVKNDGKDDDLKDFYCMTCAKHAIISNSTFSWWGAWLINNPNKTVIAPKKWYKDPAMNKGTDNLIPDNWIRI